MQFSVTEHQQERMSLKIEKMSHLDRLEYDIHFSLNIHPRV